MPSRYLTLTRKHSWQCLPNPLRSGSCFDGNYDRDDIYFVYPADEGTRTTSSPLADQGTARQFNVYVFTDTVTGDLYSVDFGAATLTATLISEVDVDTQNGPFDWLEGTNGWRIYIANGLFQFGLFSAVYCPSATGADQSIPMFAVTPGNVQVQPPGTGDDGGGGIIYTPPDGEPTSVTIECPEFVKDFLSVDFTEPPPTLPTGVTVANYHWDFGDGDTEETGSTNTVHHNFPLTGSYDVVVTVTTSAGATLQASGPCALVEVQAPPIECDINIPFVRELWENAYCDTPFEFVRELFVS